MMDLTANSLPLAGRATREASGVGVAPFAGVRSLAATCVTPTPGLACGSSLALPARGREVLS
jgi:hypothetical protein